LNGFDKLANKIKMLLTSWHFPIQQAHETCCHVSNELLLKNL
jgi:hypothetical protein